jgi:uncharacterized repeat protein (TIGR03803 family)
MDKDSNLYGTTFVGGTGTCTDEHTPGCGTVFEITAKGIHKVLHSFDDNGTDGWYPAGGVIMDGNGNLYGTTIWGGADSGGTVFEVSATGTETVLHNFSGTPDGWEPSAGLVMDKDGNLYGVTYFDGAYGYGMVFELSANGTETILHSFSGSGTDGANPEAGLVMDKKGNLYGTDQGGANGYGTVFELSAKGTETILHAFGGVPDGCSPATASITDTEGNLAGTTSNCGAHGYGTVFALVGYGADGILYSFAGSPDGSHPYGGLVMDKKGNLYGTTAYGGAYGYGTVFELSANGTETILHSFNYNGTDGCNPEAGLVMDKKGNLYGTTQNCGANSNGVVFKLVP